MCATRTADTKCPGCRPLPYVPRRPSDPKRSTTTFARTAPRRCRQLLASVPRHLVSLMHRLLVFPSTDTFRFLPGGQTEGSTSEGEVAERRTSKMLNPRQGSRTLVRASQTFPDKIARLSFIEQPHVTRRRARSNCPRLH